MEPIKESDNRDYWAQIMIWAIAIGVAYTLFSYNVPLYPWGIIDEESQFFFSALLIKEGELPFFFRQPGFFVANIGGSIAKFLNSNINEEIKFLNIGRAVSFVCLFASIAIFTKYFIRRHGSVATFSATLIFLAWPGTLHWAAHFCTSAWLVPLGLLFMLAVWHATCYRPGRLQLTLVGLLAGALVAAKISSLYTVAAGLTIFLIAVWSSYRTLGQVVRTMLSLGLVAVGSYLCFAAPYFEYALHPLFATLRGVAVGSVYVTQGGPYEVLKTHLHQVWYPIALIPIFVGLILINQYGHVFYGGKRKHEVIENRTNRLWFFCFFIGAAMLSMKGVAVGDEENLVSVFRFSLPLAGLPAFLFLEASRSIHSRKNSALPMRIVCLCSALLTFYAINEVEQIDRRLIEYELEIDKARLESIGSHVRKTDIVASSSVSMTHLATYWMDANYQYAGGYFAQQLSERFPRDRYFSLYALPIFEKLQVETLSRRKDRYKRIVCDADHEEIVHRKNLVTKAIAWVGSNIFRSRCELVVEFMVTENFETRFAENLGDSPIRSRGAVLQSSPDEIVDVVVAPVYSPVGTNGDQVDKLQETVLGELEAMYPAYRIRTSNLLLRGEEFFLFRLEHRS